MRRALIPTLVSFALAGLTACGGGDGDAGSATAAATPTSVAPADSTDATPSPTTTASPTSQVAASTTVEPTTTTAATLPEMAGVVDDFDICASVPSLDVINAQLTEPATQLVELERGPGFAICEANGGEVDNVQFQRMTDVTRELSIELANELGATVTDLSDPPGGFAYSGAAAVVIDGVEWTVQAITWDTIGDPDSPAAIERSATLLRAWLAQMGITP